MAEFDLEETPFHSMVATGARQRSDDVAKFVYLNSSLKFVSNY